MTTEEKRARGETRSIFMVDDAPLQMAPHPTPENALTAHGIKLHEYQKKMLENLKHFMPVGGKMEMGQAAIFGGLYDFAHRTGTPLFVCAREAINFDFSALEARCHENLCVAAARDWPAGGRETQDLKLSEKAVNSGSLTPELLLNIRNKVARENDLPILDAPEPVTPAKLAAIHSEVATWSIPGKTPVISPNKLVRTWIDHLHSDRSSKRQPYAQDGAVVVLRIAQITKAVLGAYKPHVMPPKITTEKYLDGNTTVTKTVERHADGTEIHRGRWSMPNPQLDSIPRTRVADKLFAAGAKQFVGMDMGTGDRTVTGRLNQSQPEMMHHLPKKPRTGKQVILDRIIQENAGRLVEPLKHVYEVHKDCERQHCNICHGGLASCTVCHGAEGSLPTHCPGIAMTSDQCDQVYATALDYINGTWIYKQAKGQ